MISRQPGQPTRSPFLPCAQLSSQGHGLSGTISRGGLGGPTNHKKKGTIVFKYQAVLIVFGILTVAAAFRLLGALLEAALGRL